MRLSLYGAVLLMVLVVAAAALVPEPAAARVEALAFDDVWARAASRGHTSAVYMHIANHGSTDVVLVSAAADVADLVEIHETTVEVTMEDGRLSQIMRMQEVEQLVVPAGGSVELRPGGLHVMLIGLTSDLEEGDAFPLTLRTRDGETIVVHVPVTVGLGAEDHHHDHHHDHDHHDDHDHHHGH